MFALFDLDMGSHAVAAIRDLHIPFIPNRRNGGELLDTLRIRPDERLGAKYLNSGVLLIDLQAYRQERIEKKALQLIREKRIQLRQPDQTIFNAVLRTRWLELSPSFNMVTRARASFIRDFAPPVIVHFTGRVKPWHRRFIDHHPVRAELEAFLKETPWPTLHPGRQPAAQPCRGRPAAPRARSADPAVGGRIPRRPGALFA